MNGRRERPLHDPFCSCKLHVCVVVNIYMMFPDKREQEEA